MYNCSPMGFYPPYHYTCFAKFTAPLLLVILTDWLSASKLSIMDYRWPIYRDLAFSLCVEFRLYGFLQGMQIRSAPNLQKQTAQGLQPSIGGSRRPAVVSQPQASSRRFNEREGAPLHDSAGLLVRPLALAHLSEPPPGTGIAFKLPNLQGLTFHEE